MPFLVMMQDESYSKVEMLRAAVANEYRIRMLCRRLLMKPYPFSSVVLEMKILVSVQWDCQLLRKF
jgi:hypothetical protein